MVGFGMRCQRIALTGGGHTINKDGGGACNNGGLIITVMLGAFIAESGCCGHINFLMCCIIYILNYIANPLRHLLIAAFLN